MAKWFSSGDLNAVVKFGKFLAILKLVISEPSIGEANSARVFAVVGGYKKNENMLKRKQIQMFDMTVNWLTM